MIIDPTFQAHYDVRTASPTQGEIFADWRARSASYRRRAEARLDVPYGANRAETLDLFPVDGPDAPVHLFIHGGYWQAMDKADFSFVAEGLVEAGIAVAILNYGLCPRVDLDEIIAETRRAVLWLRRHAGEFGADPSNIQVSGHSAGGHLAATLLATDWTRLDEDAPRDMVRSTVSVSGLFDLEPLRHTSVNQAIGLDADDAKRLSPVNGCPGAEGRLLLAVGEKESKGFHYQSDALAEKWGGCGLDVERMVLPGLDHLAAVEALANPASNLFEATVGLARQDN